MYHLLFRMFFARMDPEAAHTMAYRWIRLAAATPLLGAILRRYFGRGHSPVSAMGITFPAQFGLAAGFDKEAVGVRGLTMLGMGYVEVGTITAQAQPGNPKPRLRRVISQRALVNRMGFNNHGAEAAARNLAKLRASRDGQNYVVGVNIGKTKIVPVSDAVADYVVSTRILAEYADYLVVNVSSPNTPGLRDLQSVEVLRPLLSAVRKAADDVTESRVPLLVKIAPDLADEDIDDIAALVEELDLDGVVAVNTTIQHNYGEGGLSGPPELERGVEVVARLRSALGVNRTIIGCGGISTADDARRYLAAGANLLQGYTAFIYEGPFWPGRLNRELGRSASAD